MFFHIFLYSQGFPHILLGGICHYNFPLCREKKHTAPKPQGILRTLLTAPVFVKVQKIQHPWVVESLHVATRKFMTTSIIEKVFMAPKSSLTPLNSPDLSFLNTRSDRICVWLSTCLPVVQIMEHTHFVNTPAAKTNSTVKGCVSLLMWKQRIQKCTRSRWHRLLALTFESAILHFHLHEQPQWSFVARRIPRPIALTVIVLCTLWTSVSAPLYSAARHAGLHLPAPSATVSSMHALYQLAASTLSWTLFNESDILWHSLGRLYHELG